MIRIDNQKVSQRIKHSNAPRLGVEMPEDFVFCGGDLGRKLYFAHHAFDVVIVVDHRARTCASGDPIGRYAVLSFAGIGDDVVAVREEMDEWSEVLARVASLTASAPHDAAIRA